MSNVERWALIPGTDGGYSASTLGRVRAEEKTIARRGGKALSLRDGMLKVSKSEQGYGVVNIRKDGRQRPYLVHRLVAETFLGPCPAGHECAHGDGNPQNASLENLRWATPTENNRDKFKHGTAQRGERSPVAKLTNAQVAMIKSDRRLQREIAADYGVHQSTISLIRGRKSWASVGAAS